ncbi:hypothetical protein DSO57_1017013, partial [Entomophthora muscae]
MHHESSPTLRYWIICSNQAESLSLLCSLLLHAVLRTILLSLQLWDTSTSRNLSVRKWPIDGAALETVGVKVRGLE